MKYEAPEMVEITVGVRVNCVCGFSEASLLEAQDDFDGYASQTEKGGENNASFKS